MKKERIVPTVVMAIVYLGVLMCVLNLWRKQTTPSGRFIVFSKTMDVFLINRRSRKPVKNMTFSIRYRIKNESLGNCSSGAVFFCFAHYIRKYKCTKNSNDY